MRSLSINYRITRICWQDRTRPGWRPGVRGRLYRFFSAAMDCPVIFIAIQRRWMGMMLVLLLICVIGLARFFPNHQLIQIAPFEAPLAGSADAIEGKDALIHQ